MTIEPTAMVMDINAAASMQPAGQSPASVIDVAQFQQSYAEAQRAQEAAAPNPATVSSASETEGVRSLLGALDSLNGRVDQLGDISKMATSSGDLTPGDMLMLSVRCHEFLFQCELTSNVANRTSDGVQQLFRQQS